MAWIEHAVWLGAGLAALMGLAVIVAIARPETTSKKTREERRRPPVPAPETDPGREIRMGGRMPSSRRRP